MDTYFMHHPIVTISATFGAGGSVIAPGVADKLALRFVNRLVTTEQVELIGAPEGLNESHADRAPAHRLLKYLAQAGCAFGTSPLPEDLDEPFRGEVERGARQLKESGGVLLGRAGAVILQDYPTAFHIRLDGPLERRVRRAMTIEGLDETSARSMQVKIDRARAQYVRRLYNRDAADMGLYHMAMDSTVMTTGDCIELICTAARRFWASTDHREVVTA